MKISDLSIIFTSKLGKTLIYYCKKSRSKSFFFVKAKLVKKLKSVAKCGSLFLFQDNHTLKLKSFFG